MGQHCGLKLKMNSYIDFWTSNVWSSVPPVQLTSGDLTSNWLWAKTKGSRCMWPTRSLPCLKMITTWTSGTSSQTSCNIKSRTAEIKALARWDAADITASASDTQVTKKLDDSSPWFQKEYISKTNVIEMTDLDKGESYCFNVQAFIPSRSTDKQLGELSQTQCSTDEEPSIFEGEQGDMVVCLDV